MSLPPAPTETEDTSLRGGRLGVVGIVFYVVAAASPLVGMTGALPVATVPVSYTHLTLPTILRV